MKKRVLLLITLVVSLFIYSGRVNAAKEITCIYESHLISPQHSVADAYDFDKKSFMIFQDSDGIIGVIDSNPLKNFSNLDNSGWRYYDYIHGESPAALNEYVFNYNTAKYDTQLNACPDYFELTMDEGEPNKISFMDDNGLYQLVKQYERLPKNIDYTFETNKDYSEKISNTEWSAKCDYDKYSLYFNKNELLLIDSTHTSTCMVTFDVDSLYSTLYGACPPALYLMNFNLINLYNENYTDVMIFSLSDKLETMDTYSGFIFGLYISGDRLVVTNKHYFEEPQIVDNQCDKLLCDETIDKIMKYFNVIKIAIPIIIIGFGIIDFSKAVFGNDDDMKKARKTFILRIVAAILFFLSPIFIKLILSIANNVWDYISPDIYIK